MHALNSPLAGERPCYRYYIHSNPFATSTWSPVAGVHRHMCVGSRFGVAMMILLLLSSEAQAEGLMGASPSWQRTCAASGHSRLQRSVCKSTAEAEYISASEAAREGIFHRETALDMGSPPLGPTQMLLDSKSAIDMCFDAVAFKKTKHILRDAYFLRDVVARGIFKPEHVPSEDELADVMSKAVARPVFMKLRPKLVSVVRRLGVCCASPVSI